MGQIAWRKEREAEEVVKLVGKADTASPSAMFWRTGHHWQAKCLGRGTIGTWKLNLHRQHLLILHIHLCMSKLPFEVV